MDNKTSLLLGLVGLFVGAIAVIVFNYFRNSRMAKKAESLLDKAQKDADKLKRDIRMGQGKALHQVTDIISLRLRGF